jgi:hypothetical protein
MFLQEREAGDTTYYMLYVLVVYAGHLDHKNEPRSSTQE